MNFTEKVKVLEDYGVTEHVYTLREFVQEEDGEEFDPDVPDPYGSGDEAYEECYLELKDLLYRVKKKLQWKDVYKRQAVKKAVRFRRFHL